MQIVEVGHADGWHAIIARRQLKLRNEPANGPSKGCDYNSADPVSDRVSGEY
jgi:hypothetical protein